MTFLIDTLTAGWDLLVQSGAYLLFGFALAGLIHALIPVNKVSSWLGPGRWRSVVNASLIGTPLPLCSCSVVPVAAALRKSGASKGATTAFLISTPESGVDSIAVTYALLDPVMTVARPLSAFITATLAGLVQNSLDATRPVPAPDRQVPPRSRFGLVTGAGDRCEDACACEDPVPQQRLSLARRLGGGLRFGLVDLFEDLALYLVAGFVLAGLLSVLLGRFDLETALGSRWAPLIMLVAGVPVYVCAASATPLVAVLIGAGLSPGAGLVFLLAGPATNAATLVLLNKVLGFRSTLVYVLSIMICALGAGYLVDAFYAFTEIAPRALTGLAHDRAPSTIQLAAALILLGLILNGLRLRYWPQGKTVPMPDHA